MCADLTYACISTFADLAGFQTGGAFPRKTNKTNGLETLERGKNDMSITLVKCMTTGYEAASGTAPARKLVFRN